MSYVSAFPVESAAPRHFSTHTAPAAPICPFYEKKREADRQFIDLLEAYRNTGGLARSQEVISLFRRHRGLDLGHFQHGIAARRLIHFEWHSLTWLPLFQFQFQPPCACMALQPGLEPVLAELVAVYDHWEVAQWFVKPTPALGNNKPLDALDADPQSVRDAARMDRFIIHG